MKKVCGKCKIEKDLDQFYNNKIRTDGKHNSCKQCMNLDYNPKTKEQADRDSKNYRLRHPEKVKQSYAKWYINNKNNVYERNRKRSLKSEVQQKTKDYYNANRDLINERKRLRRLSMSEFDIQLKKLRDAFNKTLIRCRRSNNRKPERYIDLIGCNLTEFKSHIEKQFLDDMGWANHGFGTGKWNIDHIKPLISFNLLDRTQHFIAFNYKNTRPVWFNDHMKQTTREWKSQN